MTSSTIEDEIETDIETDPEIETALALAAMTKQRLAAIIAGSHLVDTAVVHGLARCVTASRSHAPRSAST